MEEFIIIKLLNNFKSIIYKLKLIDIEDPLDYLKEVVNILHNESDSKYIFDDCEQMSNLIKKLNIIKQFFKNEKHKTLKSMISYIASVKVPSASELTDLASKKRRVEERFISIDINELILDNENYNIILNDFNNFRETYSEFYIYKHNEINSLRGNFCEHLLTSSQFNLLSQLSSIEQIRQTLLNPPTKIKSDIQLIRNQKCIITNEGLSEKLERNPLCSNCNTKFEDFYADIVSKNLNTHQKSVKQNINKTLLNALKIINDKKDKIKEVLVNEKYNNKSKPIEFFERIFEYFSNTKNDDERITELDSIASNLYNIFTDDVLEVIRDTFKEEPVEIVIDLILEIVEVMDSKIYSEKEIISKFIETIELAKEKNKTKKFEELGLAPDDDKPIIHFRFKKI